MEYIYIQLYILNVFCRHVCSHELSKTNERPPITQFSTSGNTSQLRRSSRQSKPPDRYGVWLNSVLGGDVVSFGLCTLDLNYNIHDFD